MNDSSDDYSANRREALEYHRYPKPGKFEIVPTKPLSSQRDLALAYSPGVAEPCRAIYENPSDAYAYTNKANLVGVISNGTATLGLGDIGAVASKPVMEGKAVLFKHLAGIDAFDLELEADDVDSFVSCVKALEPTFGAINLEDIGAPACFEVERRLRSSMDIPVFHDDQHGTAIITGAGLLNALELQGKDIGDIRVVFAGAGAAGIACAKLYVSLGVDPARILMCDEHGVVHDERQVGMNEHLEEFAQPTDLRTLEEAIQGADVLVGVSVGGIVSQKMVASMAPNPIIFALANPEPEIRYPDAMAVRDDLIMATGRSDFPNQVNNVLGFPFIFRGALDASARSITEQMKIAAVEAIADLAKSDIPEEVSNAYGDDYFTFGPNYILPKPFDPRALLNVAPAVAKAADESGVARHPKSDLDAYCEVLERMQSRSKGLIRRLINKAKRDPQSIVFPDGQNSDILRASQRLVDEGIGEPILMGDPDIIRAKAQKLELDLDGMELFDHREDPRHSEMVQQYYELRQRHGVTLRAAQGMMKHRSPYGMMLVRSGRADAIVSGIQSSYSESIKPALRIIGVRDNIDRAAGAYIVVTDRGVKFFADTTVNIDPDAQTLAEVAINTADLARTLEVEPTISMLSYSNFGASNHPEARRVRRGMNIVKQRRPDLEVDGEMQVDVALDNALRETTFEFADIDSEANVLVFPNLDAGNIAYKLINHLSDAELIGPVLLGMQQPVNILQRACGVTSVVNLAVITALKAQADGRDNF